MRHLVIMLGLVACEHADDIGEGSAPEMPPATVETQRINVDEIGPKVVRHAGVAPVRLTPLADPQVTVPRAQVSAFEDAPPPKPTTLTVAQQWFASLSADDRKTVREICREGRHDACFGMLPRPRNAPPTRMETLLAQLASSDHDSRHAVYGYCRERFGLGACDTPLVVAFEGEAVAFEPSRATFAFQPGLPVNNDWPTAATPWIALDRDGDGAITSGAELFGDATEGVEARNGFEALASLDANRDGVIDRRDPAFAKLVLWSDRDGDRRSSPSELRPLAELIESLPLAYEVVPRCANGNCEGERAAITWRAPDGQPRSGAVIDVYLRRRF
jgi:hypothetical protein